MFLLDTDHIGIIQRQTEPEFDRLAARMQQYPLTDFYVPIVSFHEQVAGWNAYINRTTQSARAHHGGSYPPGWKGWQRQMRRTPRQAPRMAPCLRTDSMK